MAADEYNYDPILDDAAAAQNPDDDFFKTTEPFNFDDIVIPNLPASDLYDENDPFAGSDRKFREFAQTVYSRGMYTGYDEILSQLRKYYQELIILSERSIPGEEFVTKRQIALARNSSEATNHRIINSVCMEFIQRSNMIHEARGATPLFAKERTMRLLEIVDTLKNCGLSYEEIHSFLKLPLDKDADAVLEQKAAEMARDDKIIGSFAVMRMIQQRLLPAINESRREQEEKYQEIIETQQKQIQEMTETIRGFQQSIDLIGQTLGIQMPDGAEAANSPADTSGGNDAEEPAAEPETEKAQAPEEAEPADESKAEESSTGLTLNAEDFAEALKRIERLEKENEELRAKKKGFFARLFGG